MIRWNTKQTQDLCQALVRLRTASEAKRFLRDLLTEEEMIEFGKRWQAAQLLDRNIPYTDIVKRTGLSSTTIARVSKWLNNGMDGYRLMLRRVHHHAVLAGKGLP
jgi:TrpR-related protein YerC/YecD